MKDAVEKLKKAFVQYYPGLKLSHQKIFMNFDKNKDETLSK